MDKILEFKANISDVKAINPLFSTCKVRVMYTGQNRNASYITKNAVEKALPTLKNIPIVGEYSVESEDYKGHGGKIDIDTYKYIHTTKPYGVVPESATYEWEEVKGDDGVTREYLTIHGCYLWTGRYEEAYDIIENGKGQSMEIEITDGKWSDEKDTYIIDGFNFSALCILGDNVEPAFEDASITGYSLNKNEFKKEFSHMIYELKTSLSEEKGDSKLLEELLEKYSISKEDLTAKNIDFESLNDEDLEVAVKEAFDTDVEDDSEDEILAEDKVEQVEQEESQEETVVVTEDKVDTETEDEENHDEVTEETLEEVIDENTEDEEKEDKVFTVFFEMSHEDIRSSLYGLIEELGYGDMYVTEVFEKTFVAYNYSENKHYKIAYQIVNEKAELVENLGEVFAEYLTKEEKDALSLMRSTYESLKEENEELKEFKLDKLKDEHESNSKDIFEKFQLNEEDVKDINVHEFSLEEIEEKCYAILGKKVASKKNFTKKEKETIKLSFSKDKVDETPYGGLVEKYRNK